VLIISLTLSWSWFIALTHYFLLWYQLCRGWLLVSGSQPGFLHVACFILPTLVHQRRWKLNWEPYMGSCAKMICLWLGDLLLPTWENLLLLLNLLTWNLTSCPCLMISHRMVCEVDIVIFSPLCRSVKQK